MSNKDRNRADGRRALLFLGIFLAATVLPAACHDDHDDLLDAPAGTPAADSCVTLAFQFAFTSYAATRAEWTDEQGFLRDDGADTKWENYINIDSVRTYKLNSNQYTLTVHNDFRIYILDNAGKYLYTIDNKTLRIEQNATQSYLYTVYARLPDTIGAKINGQGFKIWMLANWGFGNKECGNDNDTPKYMWWWSNAGFKDGYPAEYSSSNTNGIKQGTAINSPTYFQLANFEWNYKALSSTHTIPVYGLLSFDKNESAFPADPYIESKKTLHLLRALAKVQINFDLASINENKVKDQDDKYVTRIEISSCKLVNFPLRGYNFPTSANMLTDTDELFKDKDADKIFNPSNTGNSNFSWVKVDSVNSTSFIISNPSETTTGTAATATIYIPETQCDPTKAYGKSGSDSLNIVPSIMDFTITIHYQEHDTIKNNGEVVKTIAGTDSIGIVDKEQPVSYWVGKAQMKPLREISRDMQQLRRNYFYEITITSLGEKMDYTVCVWDNKTAAPISFD